MHDVICDVINRSALSCNNDKISVYDAILIERIVKNCYINLHLKYSLRVDFIDC